MAIVSYHFSQGCHVVSDLQCVHLTESLVLHSAPASDKIFCVRVIEISGYNNIWQDIEELTSIVNEPGFVFRCDL